MNRTGVAIGMDMGGTNLRLGVVDAAGKVHTSVSRQLGADRSPEKVAGRIVQEIRMLADWCREENLRLEAACLAAPGIISRGEGLVAFSPNLPGWKDVPLRDMVAAGTGLPATLENDANAAAFGEFWKGGDRGIAHLVMFTLGTGVGGGIISDGRLIRGARGMAGELGHITVVGEDGRMCKCGNRGCLEAYTSARSIVERITERWKGEGLPPPTAREAYLLAREGDVDCLDVFREAGTHLGVAMADVVNILNTQVIVIGGGASEAWDLIIPAAEEEMRRRAFRHTDLAQKVAVRRTQLGEMAGVVGSAGLFWCGV